MQKSWQDRWQSTELRNASLLAVAAYQQHQYYSSGTTAGLIL